MFDIRRNIWLEMCVFLIIADFFAANGLHTLFVTALIITPLFSHYCINICLYYHRVRQIVYAINNVTFALKDSYQYHK